MLTKHLLFTGHDLMELSGGTARFQASGFPEEIHEMFRKVADYRVPRAESQQLGARSQKLPYSSPVTTYASDSTRT
jgi:hypothetical protein